MFTPKVIGLGGIFFKAKKPDKIQYFLWSVFKNDTGYFSHSKKGYIINFRF